MIVLDRAGRAAARSQPAQRPRRRVRREQLPVLAASGVLVLVGAMALVPGAFTAADPILADPIATLRPPGAEHPFGTDLLGRDVWARVVHGARHSLFIGLTATVLALLVGVLLGLAAGVGHRYLDEFVSRVFDVLGAFPELLLALLFISLAGTGTANLIIAIGIAAAPRYGRVVRAETLAVRNAGYVEQAALLGIGAWARALRHVLPNALGTIPILATLGLGSAIISAAGLGFLGFGPQPPLPEWGSLLAEGRNYLRIGWWLGVFPGLAITVTVVATAVVGGHLQRRFERRNSL
ncbi:ABC transporter permease [Pseudonocardia sp. NPDC046786]|uniref:ABC transporter permease n=1 Tax=Pseudonocardia sp. NPDC046786 TaxID=3155471 RepID=UPI0033E94A44